MLWTLLPVLFCGSFRYLYGIYISPAIANGVAYVVDSHGTVYALDAGNGTQVWTYYLGQSVYTPPAVANGVVYVAGALFGGIYALDAPTGVQHGMS